MRVWILAAVLALAQAAQQPAPLGPGSPPPVPLANRGLVVGDRVPTLNLVDQTGRVRNVPDLAGPKGLVILFVRSADW